MIYIIFNNDLMLSATHDKDSAEAEVARLNSKKIDERAYYHYHAVRILAAIRGVAQGTEARVCDDIAERQALGIGKYGTTVSASGLSLREWLQHAYEECLDQAVYLKRAIEELQDD